MNASEVIAYLESRGVASAGVLISPPSLVPKLLIPICEDYLGGRVSDDDLQEIGRVLLTNPERGDYAPELDYPNSVENILVEWYAPEVHSPGNAYFIRKFMAETTGQTKDEPAA